MKQLNLTLALAAGLIGGALSHYLLPRPVEAQSQTPKELRAQSFILEDAGGKTLGTFSPEPQRTGSIAARVSGSVRLFDDRGREVWRTPTRAILPASE